MKYNKYNIEQNKHTQKKKKLNYTFKQEAVNLLSKLVTRFRHESLGISNEKRDEPDDRSRDSMKRARGTAE